MLLIICETKQYCKILESEFFSKTCYSEVYNDSIQISLQLCLLAKCFKPALPYLDVDMMDICKENGAYDAKHFLCYYYYGGMIYTGLKNFERALYFYEQVISFLKLWFGSELV